MAELSPLQTASLMIGVVGGLLGVINTVQSWRKNRPIVSVKPDAIPLDGAIGITIKNPGSRPITVTHSRCIREPHSLEPEDYTVHIERKSEHELNVVIDPQKSQTFVLNRGRDSIFLLLIFWHTNAAVIFSLLPLFVFRTKSQVEQLKRTRRSE